MNDMINDLVTNPKMQGKINISIEKQPEPKHSKKFHEIVETVTRKLHDLSPRSVIRRYPQSSKKEAQLTQTKSLGAKDFRKAAYHSFNEGIEVNNQNDETLNLDQDSFFKINKGSDQNEKSFYFEEDVIEKRMIKKSNVKKPVILVTPKGNVKNMTAIPKEKLEELGASNHCQNPEVNTRGSLSQRDRSLGSMGSDKKDSGTKSQVITKEKFFLDVAKYHQDQSRIDEKMKIQNSNYNLTENLKFLTEKLIREPHLLEKAISSHKNTDKEKCSIKAPLKPEEQYICNQKSQPSPNMKNSRQRSFVLTEKSMIEGSIEEVTEEESSYFDNEHDLNNADTKKHLLNELNGNRDQITEEPSFSKQILISDLNDDDYNIKDPNQEPNDDDNKSISSSLAIALEG